MTRSWVALTLAPILACATVGRNFDATQLAWLQNGETTKEEVLKTLGPPWRVGVDSGQLTWTYGYYQYRAFGDSNSKDLTLHFSPQGTVTSFTLSSSFPSERDKLDPAVAGK